MINEQIERIKELGNQEIKKLKELKNLKRIAEENLQRIVLEEQEIEKEAIANLTNKWSIIPKEIFFQHFFKKSTEI